MSSLFWRKFGIELEFSTEFEEAETIVTPIIKEICGNRRLYCLNKVFKSNDNKKQWHLKADHSTHTELVTPISSYNDLFSIKKVIGKIEKSDLEITKEDGLHFHLQVSKNKADNIILGWLQIENILLKCFPRHRRNNYYCERINRDYRRNSLKQIFEEAKNLAEDHHSDISLEKYNYRNTVEFRLSEGTKNPNIVENWLKFYELFLNYAENINFEKVIKNSSTKDIKNIQDVIFLLKVKSEKICDFLKKRYSGNYS
jgi:hypothetical protein